MKKQTKKTCFKIVGYPEGGKISQTTSSSGGDTGREEETKSQVIYGRAAVTHGAEKREEDTSPGKFDKWIFDCGATDTMTLMILTVSPHLLKPILK